MNMDWMLEEANSNSIEKELENIMNGLEEYRDPRSLPNSKNSSKRKKLATLTTETAKLSN